MKAAIVLLCLLAVSTFGFQIPAEGQPMFKTAVAASSQALYDLIEKQKDKIFIVAFYVNNNKHEDVVSQVETSLWAKRDIFDKVIYVPIDAKDHYQYQGILYDLGIINETAYQYPYFLVVKEENGNIINGPKSAQIIREIILNIDSGKK